MPSFDSFILWAVGLLFLIVGLRILWARRFAGRAIPPDAPKIREPGQAGSGYTPPPPGVPPPLQRDPSPVPPPRSPVGGSLEPESSVSPPPDGIPPEGFSDSFRSPPVETATRKGKPREPAADRPPAEWSEEEILALIANFASPRTERFRAIREAGDRKMNAAVPALIEVLYEPEPTVSAAAAESLGKIGDPQAIEPLLEVTRRNDLKLTGVVPADAGPIPSVGLVEAAGEAAATEAARAGNPFNYKEMTVFKIDLLPKEYFQPDGSPIPRRELVQKGLKDNDHQLRKMAAKAAIGMHDPDLVPVLIDTLKNPYEVESVRYLAAEALGEMRAEEACAPLLDALRDQNVAVRYSAASALSFMAGEEAVRGLVQALRDENEFVRSQVAFALGKIGDPEALDALFDAIADGHEVVRFSVAEALGRFPGRPVVQEVEKRLAQADRSMRLALIEVLGKVKDDQAIALLRQALRDSDPDLSFKASLALMEQGSLEVLDELIEASRRLDRELMDWLTQGQPPGNGPEPASRPAGLPPDPADVNTQFKTYSTLGLKGDEDQAAALEKLAVALQHASPNVRGCAANALGDFRGESAIRLLLTALQDEHEYVRATALSSLGKHADPEVLTELERYLEDPSEEVRYALARMLGGFRDLRAVRFLEILAAKDPSTDVKRVARQNLEPPEPVGTEPPAA